MRPPRTGRLSVLIILGWMLLVVGSAAVRADLSDIGPVADRSFESITIQGVTYRGVTVYSRTDADVILKHEQGLTGLKVANLDNPTLRRLGYRLEEPDPMPPVANQYGLDFLAGILGSSHFPKWGALTLIGLVVLTAGFYIYTSYLFWLICVKTETAPGILIWLPGLQVFPLLRAARMSSLWAVVALFTALGTGYVVRRWPEYALWSEIFGLAAMLGLWSFWAIRICRIRGKGIVTAILLLFPGVNYLALLYLAGSK